MSNLATSCCLLQNSPGSVSYRAAHVLATRPASLTNFIQFPLPEGSKTGAIKGLTNVNTPGALGKGQQSAFALTTFLTFWVYCTPLLGAYVADAHLGRFKTISWAVLIVIIGHILMVSRKVGA